MYCLQALWGICGRAAAARDAGAAEAEAQMSRTRASLALIAMVAAQQPATVQDNLDTLLQVRGPLEQLSGCTRACLGQIAGSALAKPG